MLLADILPILQTGSIPASGFLAWRLLAVEQNNKQLKADVVKLRQCKDLIFIYLSKKDTNFVNFINKYRDTF